MAGRRHGIPIRRASVVNALFRVVLPAAFECSGGQTLGLLLDLPNRRACVEPDYGVCRKRLWIQLYR